MTDSRAALDMDRLPWLADERKGRPRRSRPNWSIVVPWALLATLLVAGISYWLGMRSANDFDVPSAEPSRPAATVTLPQPTVAPPSVEQQVAPAPMPEVEPVPAPGLVRMTQPVSRPKAKAEPRASAKAEDQAKAGASGEAEQEEAKPAPKVEYWPAIESTGASGRMVRIGTFSTRRQAKKGWWQIVRHYPGMRRMNAVVAPVPSLRNGRTFYRLQFGTTSQAHSEILCQRMRIIGQSCVVVGLQRQESASR